MQKIHTENIKEEFCGACLTIPFALAGAGAVGMGAKKGSNKKMKKMLLWGGISVTLISLLIAFFYLRTCKSCQ